jgi:signal transduction histidine kinase
MTNLNINSTVIELPLYQKRTEHDISLQQIINLLNKDSEIPGVLIYNGKTFIGYISRRQIYEFMTKPFSHELYYNKPIYRFYSEQIKINTLKIDSSLKISEAAAIALERPAEYIYEPLLITLHDHLYALLDTQNLLSAQSKIHQIALKSLQNAIKSKTDILRIASHDLKNPLNSILGISDIIIEDTNKDSEVNSMATLVHHSALRMYEIITNLLDSAAIEDGKIKVDIRSFDLSKLIKKIIRENEKNALVKTQTIIFNTNLEDIYHFNSDPSIISGIIDNIISNAIKYSPIGGKIFVELIKNEKNIIIRVKDNGPGLTEKDKIKAFEKFQKLSARPTAGENSTGLGLYIVKQMVRLLNGTVSIFDNEPSGAIFQVQLSGKDSGSNKKKYLTLTSFI